MTEAEGVAQTTKEFTNNEKEAYLTAFHTVNKNENDSLKPVELMTVMRRLGWNPTNKEVADWIREFDTEGTGELSFPDFLSLMASKEDDDPDKEMKKAFKVFDRNGDGFVSAAELKFTMKSFGADLNEYEVNEIIEAADFNHDGKLDYNEFVMMMNSR